MFDNREEAGERIADALKSENITADIVLLTSLDDFPVGKKVASELGLPLRVLASEELKLPGKEDLAFGSVSEKGDIWIDDAMVEEFMIGERFIARSRSRTFRELNDRLEEVGLDKKPDLRSKDVIVVSQGICTGMRTASTLGSAIKSGANRKIVATPFISENGIERLRNLADEVLSLERAQFVLSTSDYYSSSFKIKESEIKQYFRA